MKNINLSPVPYQVDNPSRSQRYEMLKYILDLQNRPEDFENIIDILKPPVNILSICPRDCKRGIKVGIIGAGLAGLAAAYELSKTGCEISVFEASDRVGGRALTHYFGDNKEYFGDLGPMRIPVSHETTWHYINLFNLETKPFAAKNVDGLFYIRGALARNDPKGQSVMKNIYPHFRLTQKERYMPWQALIGKVFEKYFYTLTSEERKELLIPKKNYSAAINELDKMYYRQAYSNVGLSQQAAMMLGFLSTFDIDFFHLGVPEVFQDFYSADTGFLYYIKGGMIDLANNLYQAVNKKAQFLFKCPIDGIYHNSYDNKIILKYRDIKNNIINFQSFDYIICAIPFSSLRRVDIKPLFDTVKMQAIIELNYEVAQKTFIFFKERFWEKYPYNIIGGDTSTDLPIIELFYPSDHAMPVPGALNKWQMRPGKSPDEPGVMLATYNWGQSAVRLGNEPIDLRISDIKRYIAKIHRLPKEYIDSITIGYSSINWARYPYIWGGLCFGEPQDKTLFAYNVTLPEMNGKVYFAGEHISQKHGWQQGALQTGMLAANEIAKSISL